MPEFELPKFVTGQRIATRKVWGSMIEAIATVHPTFVGGSADLEPSNVTGGFAKMVGDYKAAKCVLIPLSELFITNGKEK